MFKEKESIYTNDKIKSLVNQRNELNRQIANEIDKEKAKYKFSWKTFLLMLSIFIFIPFAVYINGILFDEDSIWSWSNYSSKELLGIGFFTYITFFFIALIIQNLKTKKRKNYL